MTTQRSDISTLWFDGPLRRIDWICLKSMVAQGMDVTVYTYGEIPNLPAGITLADGREICDPSLLERLQLIRRPERNAWQPIANFSDFFRVALMKQGRGGGSTLMSSCSGPSPMTPIRCSLPKKTGCGLVARFTICLRTTR